MGQLRKVAASLQDGMVGRLVEAEAAAAPDPGLDAAALAAAVRERIATGVAAATAAMAAAAETDRCGPSTAAEAAAAPASPAAAMAAAVMQKAEGFRKNGEVRGAAIPLAISGEGIFVRPCWFMIMGNREWSCGTTPAAADTHCSRTSAQVGKSELMAFLAGDEFKAFHDWLLKDTAQGGDDVDYDAMFEKMAGPSGMLDLAELETAAQAYLDATVCQILRIIVQRLLT
jgi:hypothetical protein